MQKAMLECLPALHQKQIEIFRSPAKRKVVMAGRRVGKTTLAAWVAILKATEGRRVLLSSPSQKQADAFWEKCKTWLAPYIESGDIIKNETRRTLEFTAFGGHITAKTASDADALRGDYADFLVLDECAMLDQNAWYEVGAPMLLDNGGDAWFISTPRRRNWFFTLFQRAEADDTGRWAAFHFSSYDNPHLDEEALKEIMSELTDEGYRQEILAEALEGEGQVFRNIHANMTAKTPAYPEEHKGHIIVGGLDWGQRSDYTALSLICVTCGCEVHLERFNQLEWALQRNRITNSYYLWYPFIILGESNSIGTPNLEALRNDEGMPVQGFDTNKQTKGQIIRQLALALERNTFQFIPNSAGISELEAYESVVSKVTGHISYSAPEGLHDDTVIARALAVHAALNYATFSGVETMSFSEIARSGAMHEETEFATTPDSLPSGYNQAMPTPPGRPW